jgi:uncharacterized Zn ribbon protein
MIDPELKYCPKCKDEYMPHAEKCAACEIELVSGNFLLEQQKEKERKFTARGQGLSEDDDLVIIHKGSMVEMKHLQELFEAERISSLIIGDDQSCGKGCCPSTFFMQIRKEDAPDAFMIIKAEHHKQTGLDEHDTTLADAAFDPDAEQVMCPACGHNFEPSVTTCPDCGLCFG